MLDHFLRLGGVTTAEEFYKKFPKETDFDNHVYQQMKYGGGINAYDSGGPILPGTLDKAIDTYRRDSFVGPTIPTTSKSAPSKKSSVYGGVSVVDYLSSMGKPTDKASRKVLAESLGIEGYTGKPGENNKLLKMLQSNPAILKQPLVSKKPSSAPSPVASPNFQVYNNELINMYNKPQKQAAPVKKMGVDSGFRPYAPNQIIQGVWPYNQPAQPTPKKTQVNNTAASTNNFQRYPGRGTSFELDYNNYEGRPDQVTAKPTTAKAAAKQKEKQARIETAASPSSWKGRNEKGQLLANFKDARNNLESGVITDKGTNTQYVIQNGKVVKSYPVLTGQAGKNKNKDTNVNNKGVGYLESHPEARSTPTGTYFMNPNPDIYGAAGYNLKAIPAYGKTAPDARAIAMHIPYGTGPKGTHGYDPAEGARRLAALKSPNPNDNYGSYGCVNTPSGELKCLTQNTFPQGDTTIVVDSRYANDKRFIKNKNRRKMGGEPCYNCGGMYEHGGYYGNVPQHGNPGAYGDGDSGTFSGGQYFDDGGTFVPDYGAIAMGQLPQYAMGKAMYGMGMAYGGMYAEGGMSPEEQAMMAQQQGQQSPDPQQVMQEVAQMLQQGAQPEQIMQQLVQEGIPQDQAQQIIQQVMQQMQSAQQQQEVPPSPQGGMRMGGSYKVGGEYDMSPNDIQNLIKQGYKIQYI